MDYTIRPVSTDETPLLWQMLYYAAHMNEGDESLESAQTNPDLLPYVTNWGVVGDIGLIAVEQNTQKQLGAAWVRVMPESSPLYRFVAPTFPELAIAVLPDALGQGIGSQLLTQLLEKARALHPGIVLSVRAQNPAKQLYERLGFNVVAEMTNRIGGVSVVMKVDFSID